MQEYLPILYILILLIALLYSSVGHGGASGYLALMAIFSMPLASIKPVALILNIAVSLIAFIQFYINGFFDKKIFFLLAMASVPAAYAGGLITIHPTLYKQILSALLFITAIRLIIPMKKEITISGSFDAGILLGMGASIGFVSGIIGIGGGVLLSPLLILIGYSDVKKTAGISALFIFVNSIAGLLGQLKQGIEITSSMHIMITVAITGGLIGSYIGAKQFNSSILKKVLACVLIFASLKLMFV